MSISDEERVSVEVEGFDPDINDTNKGKDLVIVIHYFQEFEGGNPVYNMMKFRLTWECLNPQTLFNNFDITVFAWLDILHVVDDFARVTLVDHTLLYIRELLQEMRHKNLCRPSHLGLNITLKVFEEVDAVIDAEPEYHTEDESDFEYIDQNGEYNTMDESEPEYYEDDDLIEEVTYPQVMDIEEENQQVGNNEDEVYVTVSYRGVHFVKIDEVGPKADGSVCPICLEELRDDHRDEEDMMVVLLSEEEDDEEVAVLSCQHILHKQCLAEWSLRCAGPPKCPLCRLPFHFSYQC